LLAAHATVLLLLHGLRIIDFEAYRVLYAHIVGGLGQLDPRVHRLLLLCILLVDEGGVVAGRPRVEVVTSVKIHLLKRQLAI